MTPDLKRGDLVRSKSGDCWTLGIVLSVFRRGEYWDCEFKPLVCDAISENTVVDCRSYGHGCCCAIDWLEKVE